MNRIDAFLDLVVNQGGSDLHVVAGEPLRLRLHGDLQTVRFRDLSARDVNELLEEFMTDEQRQDLERSCQVDFAYQSESAGRFRANVYQHVGGLGAALRVVPTVAPTLESLGLPETVKHLLAVSKGLMLVTGPTGSGKSTTLAAMVRHLNETRRGHILTLEDPIEFVHENQKCVVTQREIGAHTPTFRGGLRDALREDADVILVGEMRDPESIALALTAAETGALVLGTLHTNGAVRCVDRIVNSFPSARQEQVRSMLADSLRLVISQQLVRKSDRSGRLVAAEILVNTAAASSIIRQAQTHKLLSVIQSGSRAGMQSLDTVLMALAKKGVISGEEAYDHSVDRSAFSSLAAHESAA